ncbi:hypothetical protein SAMN02745157_3190 [Kaistia soli DSM 19436]|uniref:Uncharacterized protein n=1 Tax=Kaistia soli DSM 19436 TaxID=1122133 RepID=A0A1M5FVP7_9HYPH|nr:hypothetical protein [Kaistia soli]SHF95630.1 hypothetical protein SAMN02745157_3190 [Kaistia soli DSM 19436]
MQFFYTDPQTEFERMIGGYFYVNALGQIEPGDDRKFTQFLKISKVPPRTTVYIDSSGGDVDAAIGIGRAIREHWLETTVGKCLLKHDNSSEFIFKRDYQPGRCMSAATLILIGGRIRLVLKGGQVGVHQFSFRNPTPDAIGHSQVLSARIAGYIHEMGISPEFMALSASTRSDEITIVTEAELERLKVITGGQTTVVWTVQARRNMIYVRGERDSIYGHHKIILNYLKESGFMFWAVIEAQGREHELMNFVPVELVVKNEEIKIDVSSRCHRIIEGMYVNVFVNLSEAEARTIAFSDSVGIHIRGSREAGMFLGIAPMATSDGKEQLATFFNVLCS